MNLNSSSAASLVMDFTRPRAAAGSRNSSTNFIVTPHSYVSDGSSGDLRGVECVDLVDVVRTHPLDLVQGQLGLELVDLRHREADVHEHPVTNEEPLISEQPDADHPLHPVDGDLGEMLLGVGDLDDLTRYS